MKRKWEGITGMPLPKKLRTSEAENNNNNVATQQKKSAASKTVLKKSKATKKTAAAPPPPRSQLCKDGSSVFAFLLTTLN